MKYLILFFAFLLHTTFLHATHYWVGGAGDWNVATNWSPATLPTAADNVVIEFGSSIVTIPAGYTALGKRITVNGGSLTINGTGVFESLRTANNSSGSIGTLNVNGTLNLLNDIVQLYALENKGSIDNYGVIQIENCNGGLLNQTTFVNHSGAILSMIGLLENPAIINSLISTTVVPPSFINEANATISIENCERGMSINDNQPYNALNSTFDNYGTLTIEETGINFSYGDASLLNSGVFTNRTGGTINIINAIQGIENLDLFVNELGATILVNGATQDGWRNHGGSNDFAMLTNSGTITIENGNSSNNSSYSSATLFDDFTNASTGIFRVIDGNQMGFVKGSRVGYEGMHNNYGLIDIQGTYVQHGLGIGQTFTNHPCGIIHVGDNKISLSTSSILINNGWLDINHNATISITGLIINNGVIGDQYGKLPTSNTNVQNNKLIVKQTTGIGCVGEALPDALTVTSLAGLTVNGFYTTAAATVSAGTYNATANTFTPNSAAGGLSELYVKVTDNAQNCNTTFIKYFSGGILFTQEFFLDSDGDGFGSSSGVETCVAPPGYVNNDDDCDDTDPLEKPGQIWYRDLDGDNYSNGTSLTQCLRPAGAYFAAVELLGTNNDCDDNDPLEKPGQIWYRDLDGDDYSSGTSLTQCLRPGGSFFAAVELLGTNNDCDDNDPLEKPGQIWYRDLDGDDYSNGTNLTQCLRPAGAYFAAVELLGTNNDCDDNDPLEFPGQIWYIDADGDDHSDGDFMVQCLRPANHYAASELVNINDDCDDGDATVYTGAPELCDNQDNDCDNLIDEGVCGVSCTDPKNITTLPYVFSGTTNGYNNTYTAAHACNSNHMNGNDFVFKYVATSTQVGRIRLQNTGLPSGSTFYGHAVFVLDGCPDASGTNCLYSGVWGSTTNGSIYIETLPFQAGQTYFIVVSSNPAYHQWFDFTLTIDLPVGNICANAHVINDLPYFFGGSTQLLGDDYDASDACTSAHMSGNDVVFTYTPSTNQVARIRLQNTNIPAGANIYGHAVFLMDGCPDAPGTNCIASQTWGSTTNSAIYIETAVLTAGQTYYIVVASLQSYHQWFSYALTIDLPTGNICQNAYVIPSLPNTLGASTRFLGNDYDSGDACASSHMSGNDVVFKYTPTVSQIARIKLENTGLPPGSTIYGHAVFLMNGCPDDPGTTCIASKTIASSINAPLYIETVSFLAGQTYYIVVASNSVFHDWFNYTLTIDLPIGNVCENAVPVSVLPFNATNQTTCLFGDDYNSTMSCTSAYMNGNDFVYKYTPTATGTVNIALSNLSASFTGIFFLNGCPNVGTTTCIATATNTGSTNYTLNNVAVVSGNTYYIVIASNDLVTSCFNYSIAITQTALPVELVQFKADKTDEQSATLQWSTAVEVNFSHFDIERRINDSEWQYIGTLDGKGEAASYIYLDNLSKIPVHQRKEVYYRLHIIDLDGSADYSPMVSVMYNPREGNVFVFPNPATDKATIAGIHVEAEVSITILDNMGKVMSSQKTNGVLELSGLPKGMYQVVINMDQQVLVRKLIVN
jgi:uncharacterized metal-binding protein